MTSTGFRPVATPLEVPAFRGLWSGGLVSLTGTHMQLVALPYFVHEQTGSAFATALTAAAQTLPGVTLGPLAGAVADSTDSRRLLVATNAALAGITLAFCLVLVAPWWVVLVVALAQAVAAQLVAPAELVLAPCLVPRSSLPAANSLLGANTSLARLVGPAVGGLLYAWAGLPVVAVANAASFAAAAVLIRRIRRSAAPPLGDPARPGLPLAQASPVRAGAGWTAGWTEIRREPLLGRLMAVIVLMGIGEGCVAALLAPYTAEVFGSSAALGLLLSCQAVGGLAGAALMCRWAVIDGARQVMGVAALACGLLLALMVGYPLLYPALWPALVLITVAGVPFAAVAAAERTLLQTLPCDVMRGRVFGITIAAGGAAALIGMLASGYLADRTTVYLLVADAPCYLLAGLIMLRRPRTAPHHSRAGWRSQP